MATERLMHNWHDIILNKHIFFAAHGSTHALSMTMGSVISSSVVALAVTENGSTRFSMSPSSPAHSVYDVM